MRSAAQLIRAFFFVILIASWGIAASSAIAGDDEPDGLPGVLNGPSRQDVADLIRKIGRDEASDARVDEIVSFFRPRAKFLSRSFEKTALAATDPEFVAKMDAVAKDLTGKPADTRNLVVRAINHQLGLATEDHRRQMINDFERRAEPPMSLSGKVVDDRERPIANVVVSTSGALTRTDDKGMFVLKFRRPRYLYSTVSLEAKGYALGETTFDLTALQDADHRTYPLLKQAVCDGKVVDLKGNPVAGAEVQLMMDEGAFHRGLNDEGLRAGRMGIAITLIARSGEDGRYAFRGLPPKGDLNPGQYAYSISANHPKFIANFDNFGNDQEPRANITIPLTPGCSISGTVTDPAGKPVANTRFACSPRSEADICRWGHRTPKGNFGSTTCFPEMCKSLSSPQISRFPSLRRPRSKTNPFVSR